MVGTRARARYWWVLGLGQDNGGYYRAIGICWWVRQEGQDK